MSFLDHNFDLADTSFTREELDNAKTFWIFIIQELDPAWLKKPKGDLGKYWLDTSLQAMTYLVLLGKTIESLLQSITNNSKVEFLTKIKQLLYLEAEQYISCETEFLAMRILSQKLTPLRLKPLVPEHLIGSSEEPRSPDLSIHLPAGETFWEITVLRVAMFDEWDKSIKQFIEKIGKGILGQHARRIIGFELPVAFRLEELSNKEASVLVEFILETEEGQLNLYLQNCEIYLEWMQLPHVDTQNKDVKDVIWPEKVAFATYGPVAYVGGRPLSGIRMPITPPQIYMHSAVSDPGYIPAPAYAIIVKPSEEELNEQILKSLRNTLKLKRKQFSLQEPYILIITLGHHRIPEDTIINLLVERIWNNPEYDWISGICLFKKGDLRIGERGQIMLISNPKAERPVPIELMRVFENKQEFHSDRTISDRLSFSHQEPSQHH